jgi:bacteriorhodopsin
MPTVVAPWEDTLTSGQHSLILYSLVVAGLSLFAYFLKAWTSRTEVGTRYRGAVFASLCITAVAFVSYVVLVVKFDLGYDPDGSGNWVPNSDAAMSWTSRYMDWTVTVPLLMVELIAVSALSGAKARRMRSLGIAGAFGMIFTGYLGGVVIDDGKSLTALWTWGIISSLFMVALYVLIIVTVLSSMSSLTAEAGASYRNAMILLLVVWFAYPIAYGFQGYAEGGGRTTFMQVLLSFADIAAKVGFGVLIHKVAKLRTAQDVAEGTDRHPEAIWVSSVKHSDAIQPPEAGTVTAHRTSTTSRASTIAPE